MTARPTSSLTGGEIYGNGVDYPYVMYLGLTNQVVVAYPKINNTPLGTWSVDTVSASVSARNDSGLAFTAGRQDIFYVDDSNLINVLAPGGIMTGGVLSTGWVNTPMPDCKVRAGSALCSLWISFSSDETTAQSQCYFIGTDNSINQLVYNITPETQGWTHSVLPGKAAAHENALAALAVGEVAHVFYIGQNNIVNHLVQDPLSTWYSATPLKGEAAKAGSNLACVTLSDLSYQVDYIGADSGSILQYTINPNSTASVAWLLSQPGTNTPLGCTQSGGHVYYIGNTGDIRESSSSDDLVCLPGFPAKAESPLCVIGLVNGLILVYYIDSKNRVNQLQFDTKSWFHAYL
jgi:hypothetical protein